MLVLLILSALLAVVCSGLLVRYGRRIGRRYALHVPQRFHTGDVPRLGGLGLLVSCSLGWAWMVVAPVPASIAHQQLPIGFAVHWVVPVLIAAGIGVAEDVTHRLQARWRLLGTLAAAVLATHLLQLRVPSIGLPWLDGVWAASVFPAAALPVIAIAGLPHAFNLIDGYNGLAGTVAAICCLAIAYVAMQVGDRQVAGLVLVLAGATAGFLLWNYPRGLIFAGDGGAYLWGAVIAMVCVLLVQRHPPVSPWFPMLLLAYPVMETGFSIYRKLVRGQSPGVADALHFHQLIYRRIVRGVFDDDDEARRMLMRNNRTSPYLWGFTLTTVVPAILFWNSTTTLICFLLAFAAAYVWAYFAIVRFKVPRWLRR